VVDSLRRRFQECLRGDASLEAWRALQLEILEVAKTMRRQTAEREVATAQRSSTGRPSAELWSMLGDSFWLERDVTRLTRMIENVIAEIEVHRDALEQTTDDAS
jgi:hypothetical protein